MLRRRGARADTLAVPAQAIDATLSDMAFRAVGRDAVLVTYRSLVRDGEAALLANRTSVWSRGDGAWRLHFHQGTPTAS